jgi:hypothetical protein
MASLFDRLGALFGSAPPAPAPGPAISLWAQPAAPPLAPVAAPAQAAYFHLRTGRDSLLAPAAGRVDMVPPAYRAQALIAIIPDSNRQLCFLVAPDLRAMDVRSDGMTAIAISAFRLQTDSGAFKLRHPLAPVRFMAATMPGQGAPDGCVIFDSLGQGKLDLFMPEPIDRDAVPEPVRALAAEICAAVSRPYRARACHGSAAQPVHPSHPGRTVAAGSPAGRIGHAGTRPAGTPWRSGFAG